MKQTEIAIDAELDDSDLPPDGKRAAVLAVTAARHEDLLNKLKEAEGEEEKKQAADALKTNYTEHYAIETWWREQRLAELEKRLEEMRNQVKQRQDAEEKYVEAAMTIAELWAQGIAIAPPKPGSGAEASPTSTMIHGGVVPGPAVTFPAPSTSWAPAPTDPAPPSTFTPPTFTRPADAYRVE